jgi:hypothetical protein
MKSSLNSVDRFIVGGTNNRRSAVRVLFQLIGQNIELACWIVQTFFMLFIGYCLIRSARLTDSQDGSTTTRTHLNWFKLSQCYPASISVITLSFKLKLLYYHGTGLREAHNFSCVTKRRLSSGMREFHRRLCPVCACLLSEVLAGGINCRTICRPPANATRG